MNHARHSIAAVRLLPLLLLAAPLQAQALDSLHDLGPACWDFTFENDLSHESARRPR